MRIIAEAYTELLATDPATALTVSALRKLVNAGDVPSIRIGRKILINFDALLDYLSTPIPAAPVAVVSQIRRIS